MKRTSCSRWSGSDCNRSRSEVMKKAVAAGGKLLSPLDDEGDGDRRGTMADPFGHVWMVATHKHDVSNDEIAGALARSWELSMSSIIGRRSSLKSVRTWP